MLDGIICIISSNCAEVFYTAAAHFVVLEAEYMVLCYSSTSIKHRTLRITQSSQSADGSNSLHKSLPVLVILLVVNASANGWSLSIPGIIVLARDVNVA